MTETQGLQVDPSNAEQVRAWDGDEGRYWAEHAERFDDAVRLYHQSFLDAAAIETGCAVLDVGCGAGRSTLDAARLASAGRAHGLDLSAPLLAVARRRATEEGVTNVAFTQADAQIRRFAPGSYDRVISRTGAMFFGAPARAFANLAAATRPGGRMTLLVWQPAARNEWIREQFSALSAGRDLAPPPAGSPGPFSLSDPARVRDLLADTGWRGVSWEGREELMRFGATADDAQRFLLGLLGWMLVDLDKASRARAEATLLTTLRAHETADGVQFGSATWLVSAVRR